MSRPVSTMTDEELIACFQNGSEDAFSLLTQRYTPLLQHEVARVRGTGQNADDFAQEALLGLLAAVKTFRKDGGASFPTYAKLCVHRRLINASRRFRPTGEEIGVQEDVAAEADDLCADQTADPALLLAQREEHTALENRLKHLLTEREYRVLMLFLSSCTYSEIADMLCISCKAADNALQRARRKLSSVSWRA